MLLEYGNSSRLQCCVLGTVIRFFGEILKVYYDESMINEKGSPDILKADLIGYGTGNYYSLKEIVGGYGFSKKKKKKMNNG